MSNATKGPTGPRPIEKHRVPLKERGRSGIKTMSEMHLVILTPRTRFHRLPAECTQLPIGATPANKLAPTAKIDSARMLSDRAPP
jgi:hypothetical protein